MPWQCFFCQDNVPAFASLPCGHLSMCTACKTHPQMQDLVGLECSMCQTKVEKEIVIDGHAFGAPCKTAGIFKARNCTHVANAVAMPCGHLAYASIAPSSTRFSVSKAAISASQRLCRSSASPSDRALWSGTVWSFTRRLGREVMKRMTKSEDCRGVAAPNSGPDPEGEGEAVSRVYSTPSSGVFLRAFIMCVCPGCVCVCILLLRERV